MADVRPFNAYRPKRGMESVIAALPYDVYNRAESVEVVKNNPESFLAIDRAETQFSDDVDTYDPRVYDKARDMIRERIDDGRFVQDEGEPGYYLYELTMDGRVQNGIVACASIDDYMNGVIKKHENTRADKEVDRINHVDKTGFQTGPIFLAYRHNDVLASIIESVKKGAADCDFTSDDGIRHRVFSINDADKVKTIRDEFSGTDALYIADGHHRCASAVKVGLKRREENPGYTGDEEFNYFLSVIFPGDELKILDYNRVIKDLNGLTEVQFFNEVIDRFEVCDAKKLYSPEDKGLFGMYISGKWYKLRAHHDLKSDDPVKGLDVSVLQDGLLGPVLGIGDPRTDKRIDFVGGIRGLGELERRCKDDMQVAFSMFPTSIEELFKVADEGLLMPPKSTWFEPKLRSGLFLHKIDQ
ncbi:MAG: DUF1015 domain-containing protein [Lachnospiraceae bacterium]|nr:DUF1015 domain-containing protein [Lachnospiraceae bacterium]